jgi:hypothetical protein
MAYLGNIDGPRESLIIEKLGYNYFGITPQQLESDIEWHKDSERRGEVQTVHVNEEGKPYIIFSRPNNQTSRYYLEDNDWVLVGDIVTKTDEELEFWKKRFE